MVAEGLITTKLYWTGPNYRAKNIGGLVISRTCTSSIIIIYNVIIRTTVLHFTLIMQEMPTHSTCNPKGISESFPPLKYLEQFGGERVTVCVCVCGGGGGGGGQFVIHPTCMYV